MTRPATPSRRRFLLAALSGVSVAGVTVSMTAYITPTFPFIPSHYTFSLQQVQDAVQRKFPYQRTMSQVFDVSLTHPVVGFLPDTNRVVVKLDAHLVSPFMPQPVDGVFTLSSELAYDATSKSVVLRSPNVDNVSVTGQAQAYTQQINAAAAVLATQLLTNYPIYTFKPEELQFAGVNYEPGTITILTKCIRVRIVEK
ncbi:MAG: Probable transmembrane protein [uncultured Paraburkholderia sp.]|nr:MAG: Probable transmembrane protein [uncultured Paraburkholderia sp.]CAH2929591.1 MAG: Probable transmembrane protein [uncultured Paraburkholderia sp.]